MKTKDLTVYELSAFVIDCVLADKKFTVVTKGRLIARGDNVKHIESDRPGGYILIRWNE